MSYSDLSIVFLLLFVGLCGLLIAWSVFGRLLPWKLPKAAPGIIACLAGLQLVLALVSMGLFRSQFRRELQRLDPAAVAQLVLTRSSHAVEVKDQASVTNLLGSLRSLRSVGAHHSSPRDLTEVSFSHQGKSYRYVVGRDSERPDEFWVCLPNDSLPGENGQELGRFRSPDFGDRVDRLLSNSR